MSRCIFCLLVVSSIDYILRNGSLMFSCCLDHCVSVVYLFILRLFGYCFVIAYLLLSCFVSYCLVVC
jgi:hypothetical protein